MIIAIDGPAASGKGTLAKRLAAHFGLPHLDTGLLYRAVGRAMLDRGLDLRTPTRPATSPSGSKSAISTRPGCAAARWARPPRSSRPIPRSARRFSTSSAASPTSAAAPCSTAATSAPSSRPGPNARSSSPPRPKSGPGAAISSWRSAALEPDFAEVLADIRKRDARDAGRADAPLKPAPDAHVLDTTSLDVETAFAAALAIVMRRGTNP